MILLDILCTSVVLEIFILFVLVEHQQEKKEALERQKELENSREGVI